MHHRNRDKEEHSSPKHRVEKMPTGALTIGKHVITGTAQPLEKRKDGDL